jgi:CheY-like chemotaxis protein
MYNLAMTTVHLVSSHYSESITKLQKWHLKSPEQEVIHNQKKRRILIVDDEPDTCMTFQTVLEDADYKCKSYTDSVKVLEEFKPNCYDLIILDIKMPALNGFELCKKIIEVDKTVHIVFITASEEYYEKFRNRDYSELVNDISNTSYIQTPIGNKELVQKVDILIATNHVK